VQKPSVLQTYRFFNLEGSIKTDPSVDKGSAETIGFADLQVFQSGKIGKNRSVCG
jgi:hypothetical protein